MGVTFLFWIQTNKEIFCCVSNTGTEGCSRWGQEPEMRHGTQTDKKK